MFVDSPPVHSPSVCIVCAHRPYSGRLFAFVYTKPHLWVRGCVYAPPEAIKFGEASPVICAMRDNIVFDEFEYGQASFRRTASVSAHQLHSPSVHSPYVCTV